MSTQLMIKMANQRKVGQPLCFTANEANCSIKIVASGYASFSDIPYLTVSLDNGGHWSSYTGQSLSFNSADQSCILFRSSSTTTTSWNTGGGAFQFEIIGSVSASGDLTTLVNKNGNVQDLSGVSFSSLFSGCTTLVTPPELPSTILSNGCYSSLFSNCSSLIRAPKLPAKTLTTQCYYSMFRNCTSLKYAPELPATNLASRCYQQMFANCSSLISAPNLRATTLQSLCYAYMFQNCTSLQKSPYLAASTLVSSCYNSMFSGCSSLNEIYANFTSFVSGCTTNWVSGVAASGLFHKSQALSDTTRGVSNIPEKWSIVNL